MISKARASRIDALLFEDHAARGKILAASTVLGTVVAALCRFHGLSQPNTAILSGTVTCFTTLLSACLYKPARSPVKSRKFGRNSNYSYLSRRATLYRGAVAALGLLIAPFLPNPTEAEVVNSRILELIGKSNFASAKKAATEAVRAKIPLYPDLIPITQQLVKVSKQQSLEAATQEFMSNNREATRALVALHGQRIIRISLPALYMPHGLDLIAGDLNLLWMSVFGAGPKKTVINAVPGTRAPGSALFAASPETRRDVLLCAFSATTNNLTPVSAIDFVLLRDDTEGTLAVSNVVVSYFSQTLNDILWNTVEFNDCVLRITTGRLDLYNVRFTRCKFDFAPDVPMDLVGKLRSLRDSNITLEYHP